MSEVMDDGKNVVNFDEAHGPYPEHADLITRTSYGADKMRVGPNGKILTQEQKLEGGKEPNTT